MFPNCNQPCSQPKCLAPDGILIEFNNIQSIETGSPFPFGTIITNTNPNRFQLSPDSLSLLIHKQGLYDIEWYLNSEGMNSGGQIQVALELIHTNGIITYQYNSFAITPNAALSGQFLINAPTPIILRFLNTSDGAFSLSSHTSMQGNFKILGF